MLGKKSKAQLPLPGSENTSAKTSKDERGSTGARGSKPEIRKISSQLPRISLADREAGKKSVDKRKSMRDSTGSGGARRKSSKVRHADDPSAQVTRQPSEEIFVPEYLDPQPHFFKDHMKEDMVVEYFDPMQDTEEEEELIEEFVVEELDDDFDYESLYADEPVGTGDDFDDFIPPQQQVVAKSQMELGDQDEEEEEGEEEEGAEEPVVEEENLEECDDRSDDEIAHQRMLEELYQTAFADIMAMKLSRVDAPEAPSITRKTLDEYFLDREEEKILRCKQAFQGWFYTDGSEIQYRKKILSCLDSILVKERIKYDELKKGFNVRWEVGQAKQVIIDEALVKFDSYYRETLGKQQRAVQQTAHELSQKIDKIREVNRYKKELACLLRLQAQCENRLSQFRIFERYLIRVRDESRGEFSDIRDIIDRYGVLSQARNGLISRDLRNQDKIERAQNSLKRTMELRSNELLVYNNYLSELRVYRDNIQEEILQLEEMLLHIKTTAANRTLLIGQIKMAINNLYLGLCKQLNYGGRIPPEDTLKQLNFIKTSMKEIMKLSRDVKQMLKAAAHAADRDRKEKERLEREARRRNKYKHAKDVTKANDYMALFGFKQPNE